MKKTKYTSLVTVLLFICTAVTMFADPPEWLYSIPYEKDAFLGVGSGLSSEEAMENARIDILMQLSSKVDSTMTMTGHSEAEEYDVVELSKTVITSSSLQGAEVAETYEKDSVHYILMRYCDTCGSILVSSALRSVAEAVSNRNEKEGGEKISTSEVERIIQEIDSQENSEAVKLKRELQGPAVPLIPLPDPVESDEEDDPLSIETDPYDLDNILVSSSEGTVLIRLINFLPDTGDLTEQQINDLLSLSTTLFVQLEKMGYSSLSIVGHANPEGREGEENELIELSRERAVTMEKFLKDSGVVVDSISWRGGDELLGSTESEEGRGMNRRVDIYVKF